MLTAFLFGGRGLENYKVQSTSDKVQGTSEKVQSTSEKVQRTCNVHNAEQITQFVRLLALLEAGFPHSVRDDAPSK